MSMRAETASEQLFFTTVYLTGIDSAGASWTGTGFIINYEVSGGQVPVLVTNKHVDGAVAMTVRFVRAGADGQPLSEATQTTITGFNASLMAGSPESGC